MGNFCADAYRIIGGADIGVVQGGGVRADIKAGDVTYGDIIALHPWGNMYGVIEATGQQILDALELGARSTPDEVGGFLQVSGISYEIDTTVPSTVVTDENAMFVKVAGARRVVNVKVGGVPIDPKKTYTVASTTYILTQQGDGFTMFDGCKEVTKESLVDTEVIQKYIEKLGGTIGQQYAKTEGRIKVLTASDKAPIKEYKAALARTTKITSAKASTKTKRSPLRSTATAKHMDSTIK